MSQLTDELLRKVERKAEDNLNDVQKILSTLIAYLRGLPSYEETEDDDDGNGNNLDF